MEVPLQDLTSDEEIKALHDLWEKDSKRLLYHVKRGKEGFNAGLDNGMKRLNGYIYGTHRARYYLIGADSGVGKTTLADWMYFYNLYQACKREGIPLKLDYYSFEISEVMKKTRLASLIYWMKYKEELPSAYMIGQIQGLTITPAQERKLYPVMKEVEEIFDSIHFVETPTTAVQMWQRMVERAEQNGEVLRNKNSRGLASEIIGYKPHDPNTLHVNIVDHLALTETALGQNLKQTMDMASIFFVRARNLFGATTVVVQQFNTEMQGAARESKNQMAYMPSRLDFGDSRYTYRDADVVMALTRPADFQLNSFGPFTELEKWGNYFVVNSLLKNRYGPIAPGIPYFTDPIAGIPEELPAGKEWNLLLQQAYIDRANRLDEICQLYFPKNE